MGMSASVLLAIPFALLAIVLLLCFVGCDFPLGQLPEPKPFTEYSSKILAEPTLVAYWPLDEATGSVAADHKNNHDGEYLSRVFPADPVRRSAATPASGPVLNLGQDGLLEGDRVSPFDATSPRTTSIEVNGGYVSVPFDPALNPTQADGFTIEAWVRVEWSATDTVALRVVMVSFDTAGGGANGYALLASPDDTPGQEGQYNWQAQVGAGTSITVVNGPHVTFDATTHLVLTYDPNAPPGPTLTLFVDAQPHSVQTDYQASTQSRLFIGAGAPFLPEPRFPWVGRLQCIAVYTGALAHEQVNKHALFGAGQDAS
jgi:Concanavalin A-like lectin/glucanases superfamily